MTKLFAIAVGFEDGTYFANVQSLTDEKMLNVQSTSARRVLKEVNKSVRAKLQEIQNFPLPEEPGRILRPNGTNASEPPQLSIVRDA